MRVPSGFSPLWPCSFKGEPAHPTNNTTPTLFRQDPLNLPFVVAFTFLSLDIYSFLQTIQFQLDDSNSLQRWSVLFFLYKNVAQQNLSCYVSRIVTRVRISCWSIVLRKTPKRC